MIIKKAMLENFTVFDKFRIELCSGINVFIGDNGTGKSHLLKVLYAACQSTDPKTSFSRKLVTTLLPDEYRLSRLVSEKRRDLTASIRVYAEKTEDASERILKAVFSGKTTKWDADILGKQGWEKDFSGLTSVFIPTMEFLPCCYNLNVAAGVNNIRFDDTCLDILNAAKIDISDAGDSNVGRDRLLRKIRNIIRSRVFYDVKRDEFYLLNGRRKLEFSLVAAGIRKLALLWLLVKKGGLRKGSILFWEEPEAGINPSRTLFIAELLLEFARLGIQVFVATHDYMIPSYLDVKRTADDRVLFHSFYWEPNSGKSKCGIRCECSETFADLKNNAIIFALNKLLDEIYCL